MANTTNFGWETPDDTDLVKDGAAAMRTLGNAIDTSMGDLKGGTTGQILKKTSNTDMDFEWTNNDVGDITAVTAGTGLSGGGTSGDVTLTNTVATAYDAKGDLVVGTGADTFAKLTAGTNGYTLVADSAATTGLNYGFSNTNPVINGGFDIWQRGTSFSIAASTAFAYYPDRWGVATGANQAVTLSRQATGDTTNLPNIQYCMRFQRNSGQTGTGGLTISSSFETVNSIPFAGKTVTISFYARAGANYSPTSSYLRVFLDSGTGTDQNFNTAYTNEVLVVDQNATLTTTWQRFSYTGTVPTNATELAVAFKMSPTGTAGAADYFEVTGVQIDLGSTALPFRRSGGTIQGELAACQRYYWRTIGAVQYANITNSGIAYSTTAGQIAIPNPVTMRTKPSSLDYGPALSDFWFSSLAADTVATALSLDSLGNTANFAMVNVTVASGLTAATPRLLRAATANAPYLGFNAEL